MASTSPDFGLVVHVGEAKGMLVCMTKFAIQVV